MPPLPDAAPPVTPKLRCGSPSRIQLGPVQAIAAAALDDGFAVFTATGDQIVHGWTYGLDDGGNLVPTVQNVGMGTSETQTFGAGAMNGVIGVAMAYGSPITGTQMTALDAKLNTIGSTRHDGEVPVAAPIAGNALVTIGANVIARFVSPSGSDAGSPVTVVSSTESPSDVSIVRAGTGFAVAYHAGVPAPNRARAVLLDSNLSIVAGPVTTDDLADDAYSPRAAWAETSQVLLVAWHEKNAVGGDDVWFQLLSATLTAITPPTKIGPSSVLPQVTTDGTSFWMLWLDNSTTPSLLAGAKIDATGMITPRAVVRSGGSPGPWTTVERDGQPVLVWSEINGSGPDLYFDPMCD
jgi:hypothetical protein